MNNHIRRRETVQKFKNRCSNASAKMNYDWDDIEVDDTLTHNSRYFFANYRCANGLRNPNAGSVEEDETLKPEANNSEDQPHEILQTDNKENEPTSNASLPPKSPKYSLRSSTKLGTPAKSQNSNSSIIKTDMTAEGNQTRSPLKLREEKTSLANANAVNPMPSASEEEMAPKVKNEVNQISTQMDNVALSSSTEVKSENLNALYLAKPEEVADTQTIKSNNLERKLNILSPSSWERCVTSTVASKTAKGAIPKTGSQTPRAFQFQNVYQSKREELLRKQREEERKLREFNSRPAPKFQPKSNLPTHHHITTPVTPQVLKRSKESQRKRLEKLEEIKRQCQPPVFKARENNVVKEKPFVPKKEPLILEARPFNLRCEERLRERKEFDKAIQRALGEKQKQEEERLKQEEEKHIKEIRKETNFKARPNPFNKKN